MHETLQISLADDLAVLVDDINACEWDEANDMCRYDIDSLASYLQRKDTVFVACYSGAAEDRQLMGIASARIQMKPYEEDLWLYIDEVDVAVNHRQQGAGRALMHRLLAIADEHDCGEVWLGTELDNEAGKALYNAMKPDEVERFIGYTWHRPEPL